MRCWRRWPSAWCTWSAPAEAIALCERGLAQDRTREGLYVQLMRAHGAAGHAAEAVQVYERCRRALAEELGVDPGPAVRAAHAQVLRDDGRGVDGPGQAIAERRPDGAPDRPARCAQRAGSTANAR